MEDSPNNAHIELSFIPKEVKGHGAGVSSRKTGIIEL